MTEDEIELPEVPTVICQKSYWIYTDEGGLLQIHVNLMQAVKEGDLLASMRDVFGNLIKEYFAPEDGVVIGKSVSPVNQSGGRILHLGIEK
jgi:predicted deacylase